MMIDDEAFMRYCGFDDFMTSDDKGLLIARFTILSYYRTSNDWACQKFFFWKKGQGEHDWSWLMGWSSSDSLGLHYHDWQSWSKNQFPWLIQKSVSMIYELWFVFHFAGFAAKSDLNYWDSGLSTLCLLRWPLALMLWWRYLILLLNLALSTPKNSQEFWWSKRLMGSVSFFGPQPKFMMANNVSTSSILLYFKRWTPGNTTSDRQFIQAIDPRNRRLKHGYPEISQRWAAVSLVLGDSITPAIKEVLEKTGNWLRHPELHRGRLERLQDFIRDPDPVPTSVPIQAVVEATDAPESPVRLSRQSKVVA